MGFATPAPLPDQIARRWVENFMCARLLLGTSGGCGKCLPRVYASQTAEWARPPTEEASGAACARLSSGWSFSERAAKKSVRGGASVLRLSAENTVFSLLKRPNERKRACLGSWVCMTVYNWCLASCNSCSVSQGRPIAPPVKVWGAVSAGESIPGSEQTL